MTTTLATLTEAKIDGNGVFDQLMTATKAHLDAEFKKGAIKGAEYAQVYLGQVQAAMSASLQFLAFQSKADLEAALLQKQIDLVSAQIAQAGAQTALINAQIDNAKLSDGKTLAEIDQVKAQTSLIQQQTTNALAEAVNIPKQGLVLDAQAAQTLQQKDNLVAQKEQIAQQTANLVAEALNIPKQGEQIDAQTCLLKSQYDNTVQTTLRVAKETDLMAQKIITEKAQTTSLGVDDNSVLGRQKALYQAQTAGFQRDAEQKAAGLLVQSWSTRRMTDDGVSANTDNKLDDATIGQAVKQMLTGINVSGI